MRCNAHYHIIELPNGRKIRTRKDCNLDGFDEELGFDFGKLTKGGLGKSIGKVGKVAGKAIHALGKIARSPILKAIPLPITQAISKAGEAEGQAEDVIHKVKGAIKKVKKGVQQVKDIEKDIEGAVKGVKGGFKVNVKLPQGMTPAELPTDVAVSTVVAPKSKKGRKNKSAVIAQDETPSETPPVTVEDIKQQVLAAVAQVSPVTKEDILQQTIAAIDHANSSIRANEDTAKEIASHVTPSLEKIINVLAERKLQQQATSEHKKIVKDDNRWSENKKGQNAILAKIANLEGKIAAKQKYNATVSAAFGIPDKHI